MVVQGQRGRAWREEMLRVHVRKEGRLDPRKAQGQICQGN